MPQLATRKIGSDNVTAIGFGLMGLSAFYYGDIESDEERFKVLDAAVGLGCTNWDTSDFYGDSEDLLGTKFGITPTGPNGQPEYVRSAVEKSLKRMGVDHIDLYYLHVVDPTIPIEITIGAMAELVKEGKVKYLGLSEVTAATIRRAHAVHSISAVQVEYSPICLDIEAKEIGLLTACRELGITVIAYSPVGRGMLTGTYKSHDDIPKDDWRSTVPKFSPENFPNILKLANGLADAGKKHNATAGQIALAWILEQGDNIIPIPGMKKVKYLKENLGALDIKLDAQEVAEIRNIANRADVNHEDRYPSESMGLLYVDTPELK